MIVYIVCIGNDENHLASIGAVYLSEEQAKVEVQRLNEANRYSLAYYIKREVGY